MPPVKLTVGLLSEAFFGEDGDERLLDRAHEVAAAGADLAVLPELPLDAWYPADRQARPDEAEDEDGPRRRTLSEVARSAGIALLGGAIVRDRATGERHDTALLFDPDGRLVHTYRKVHLPQEDGFWEGDHYAPGTDPPGVVDLAGTRIGVQICSDINRMVGIHLLAAQGAQLVLVPRATPWNTYQRWRKVFEVAAVTSATWIVSVNRPRPERGVPLGGASLVVGPDGRTRRESQDPVLICEVDLDEVERMRAAYPGYLAWPAAVYAEGWKRLT
jgi:N-carbamoylputrescine amidase